MASLEKALKILEICQGQICDHCLGRKFSEEIEGPGNPLRGKIIRNKYLKSCLVSESNKNCSICQNIFQKIDEGLIQEITKKIKRLNIEFSSFVVGCKLPRRVIELDQELSQEIGVDVENIKREVNREIGKLLQKSLNKETNFYNPQLVIIVDFNWKEPSFELQINPLFLEGRYRKLIRGIPQTKWPCRKCKGRGCEYCEFTGKMYRESVEELISQQVLKRSQGTSSKFHGAGREDIDVKMLGNGRPFVLEIKEPRKRKLNLKKLSWEINQTCKGKVEVLQLKYATKSRISQIKKSSPENFKTYRAQVKLKDTITVDKLEKVQLLKIIKQRTPLRVSHRRADKMRIKEVKDIKAKMIKPDLLELIIQGQGGLYIKELVSGDKGRTVPNISEVLGTAAHCVKLDVLEVEEKTINNT